MVLHPDFPLGGGTVESHGLHPKSTVSPTSTDDRPPPNPAPPGPGEGVLQAALQARPRLREAPGRSASVGKFGADPPAKSLTFCSLNRHVRKHRRS